VYAQRCALCHGDAGDGRGPQAASLPVPVPNWSDPARQVAVSDDQLRQTIVGGGPAVGKSPAMPPNPDLKDKPVLDELVSMIRGFER
jgi:mono/diheme cytochrome c family protein